MTAITDLLNRVFPQHDQRADLLAAPPAQRPQKTTNAKALFDSVSPDFVDLAKNATARQLGYSRPASLLDAPFAVNFVGNLGAYLEPELVNVPFEGTNFAQLIPVDTSANAYAPAVSFISNEQIGQATLLSAGADDVPNATANMTLRERPVFLAGIGYEFNIEEINKALLYGVDLSMAKMAAARQAADQYMMNWTLTGDASAGVTGIINTTGPNAATVAADGTGSSALWSAKTGVLMARDVNAAISYVITTSKNVVIPNTVLLSHERLETLATTLMGNTSTDTTVLEFIRRTFAARFNGAQIDFFAHSALSTAGSGSTQRMVVYRRDPAILKLPLPMPHQFLPVYQMGPLRFQVPGIMRAAQVQIRHNAGICYRDGF